MLRRSSPRAHEEFKRATQALWWQMTCLAALLHFCLFLINPTLRVSLLPTLWALSVTPQQLRTIDLLPDEAIPASPTLDSRPQVPRTAEFDLSEDVTIAETTFEKNPIESTPPPVEVAQTTPALVPSYVGPQVLNYEQVLERLRTGYNLLSKTTVAEGRVVIAFHLNETGQIVDFFVLQSSGHPWLDHVALSIKDIVWFSPAMEYGERVDVWIKIPISFAVVGSHTVIGS